MTITEVDLPAGVKFDSTTAVGGITATAVVNGAATAVNKYHSAVITVFNSEVPVPPPPAFCRGLTPGYWKNWKNHYSEAEFLSLLPGTIAEGLTAKDAKSILSAGGSDALTKLRKFVLANQLTLNLTGTDLPNPDKAGLGASCAVGTGDLGASLDAALAMLAANGSGYSESEILAVKDVLDAIANMDP